MVITYKFNDGTVSTVEVSDEIGSVIIESRKEEHANDEKQRSHCYSMDAADYEGENYADPESIESFTAKKEFLKEFYKIYDSLTETQKRRVDMLGAGLSIREIARIEGVDHKKVMKSIALAKKKFENLQKN